MKAQLPTACARPFKPSKIRRKSFCKLPVWRKGARRKSKRSVKKNATSERSCKRSANNGSEGRSNMIPRSKFIRIK
jgi:hypothetical protein